ncbi:copper chaperone PCu(A)C [Flavimobilis sp. GY10621]|uniref:Copper chaperone PCu(A)C n=1 Tax=Flavimobilis rhizosphaerae TaxID=2775421 RepID=A0ABR9DRF4_9MICO|nr:copper chaperone PCu(A)C [Flavimobilis rhizosphaerae]MBD9699568.1 copper chaperone PCu(A)C [Flavimobilis rhizosphaerae]
MNRRTLAALTLTAALALAGCSGGAPDAAPTDAAPAPGASGASTALTLADGWAKAAPSGMSAAFGTLTNPGTADVTVVSARTVAAARVELHETTTDASGASVMRPVDGFTVPAGGTRELAPGGDHLMMMELTGPLAAGDELTLELTTSDGTTASFTVPVKEFAGANEHYEGHGDDAEGDAAHGTHDD